MSTLTRLGATPAQSVAAAVRAAPPIPPHHLSGGSCSLGDSRSVTIFLTYPGQARAEVVRIGLFQGCGDDFITAPGRTDRQMVAALTATLKPAAPPQWTTWL